MLKANGWLKKAMPLITKSVNLKNNIMAKFGVTMTCIYNGYAEVEANTPEEALEIVGESLDNEGLQGFPNSVDTPYGTFNFGEATVDCADEIK